MNEMNFIDACRFCFSYTNLEMISRKTKENDLFLQRINDCVNIKLSSASEDDMQSLICDDCCFRFIYFSDFRMQCFKKDQIYRERLQSVPLSIQQNGAVEENLAYNPYSNAFGMQNEYRVFFEEAERCYEAHMNDSLPTSVQDTKHNIIPVNIVEERTENTAIPQPEQPEAAVNPRKSLVGVKYLSENYQFVCKICSKRWKTKKLLIYHIKKSHKKGARKCPMCTRVIKGAQALKDHLATAHSNERPFKCVYCTSTFKLDKSLKQHVRGHFRVPANPEEKPKTEEKEIVAPAQNVAPIGTMAPEVTISMKETVSIQNDFGNNNMKRRKIEEKPNITIVPVPSAPVPNLKISISNTKYRLPGTIKCRFCPTVVKTKTGLAFHMAQCHAERPFKCEICSRTYKEFKTLKRHLRLTHGQELVPNNYDPTPQLEEEKNREQIEVGTEEFHEEMPLEVEINEEPEPELEQELPEFQFEEPPKRIKLKYNYKCKFCNTKFLRGVELNKHRRTIHADKFIHACEFCPMKFHTYKLKYAHSRRCQTVHGGVPYITTLIQ